MKPETYLSVQRLYRQILTVSAARRLVKQHGLVDTGRIYTFAFVLWLMISQRLQAPGTTAHVVGRAASGACGRLLPRRGRERLSCRTGGYCRARQRMPRVWMQSVADYLVSELRKRLQQVEPAVHRPVYIADGSSVQVAHQDELVQQYPPGKNQHGHSHWPVVRVAVMHEARTGLAVGLAWGPTHVSEQALAKRLIEQLVAGAVLLADRNFGVFATAFDAVSRGAAVVLRLTKARAEKLGGSKLPAGTDLTVVWRPSAWDRKHHPELPSEAEIGGRLLVCELAGFREPLYLFTTLTEPAAEVLRLYGLRWNIEIDLRSLKQTVRLHRLTVKSDDMVEKELWAAIMAYNLVRTVLCLAAMQIGAHPRELSFTHVLYLVNGFLPHLLADARSSKAKREAQRLIELAAKCKLPKRKNRRSYPRAVWPTPHRFPLRCQEQSPAGK
jgi:hypothetical protein